MKTIATPLQLFALLWLLLLGGTSCGGDETEYTNYAERLVGSWELKNIGDLQVAYRNKPFMLKNATMIFEDDGSLETRMLSARDGKTWITESATWEVTQRPITTRFTGETLTIKSDNGPFNDKIFIEFTDERTFYLVLNELQYQFVKL